MALTFPLPLTAFFDGLPIQSVKFDLGEALELDQTAAGEILTADMGPRLWQAKVAMRGLDYAQAEQIKAQLNLLRYAGRSLLVHAMPICYPQSDPKGVLVNASNVQLNSVASNNRELSLKGLPPNFVITRGDFLSFTYLTNPLRYALHQVAVGATANASGVTGNIEVTPFIQPGWALNAVVTLAKPIVKMVVVPGSTDVGASEKTKTEGIGFSLIQTYRG